MNHSHLIGCMTYCGTWLLGIGVGYICAKRDWRAEALECVTAWRRAHEATVAYIDDLKAELARVRRDELETTLAPGQTYEELVQRSGGMK
jgi:hypothetical protein